LFLEGEFPFSEKPFFLTQAQKNLIAEKAFISEKNLYFSETTFISETVPIFIAE